ncbi:hypothetical protein OIU79_006344 [Salix purpurea]|uniref:Uncharacterized protein n=1 Tax=Salix purpurea TaxID=77065 RepID=A0A9Q0TV87_SALPP|nr:hypothetical protein OIU79_006344 [Salix purpurea]
MDCTIVKSHHERKLYVSPHLLFFSCRTFVLLMDFWSYASEGKGLLLSDEIDLSADAFTRSRKASIGCDTEAVESSELLDLGFSEIPRKPFHGSKTGAGMFGGSCVGY